MCFSSTQSSMSYIQENTQTTTTIMMLAVYYDMIPLFPTGFLPLPKVQGFSTYTSSPVPSSSLSPGPAPLVMPSLPPMPNGMTASASAPMEPQARQQHGGLGWVWGLGSWVVLRSKGWGNRNGMKFVFLEFLHKHVGMDLLWNWGHG